MKASGQLVSAFIAVTAWGLRRGCHSCYPARDHEKQRFVHESIYADPKMHGDAEGAFDARPPPYIPNSSPRR
jgi:hypothetical protein